MVINFHDMRDRDNQHHILSGEIVAFCRKKSDDKIRANIRNLTNHGIIDRWTPRSSRMVREFGGKLKVQVHTLKRIKVQTEPFSINKYPHNFRALFGQPIFNSIVCIFSILNFKPNFNLGVVVIMKRLICLTAFN